MTVGIIVQARMGSTRLPGKVLAPVLGRPLLAYQLERLARTQRVDRVIVATTAHPADNGIVAVAREAGADVFRGPEDDVMARYLLAAMRFGIDTIVRVTADCPLIDPAYVDRAVEAFRGDAAYLWLRGVPDGMGCEVIRRETLEDTYPDATDEEREHVTLHVRRRQHTFRTLGLETGHRLDEERWTVDTAEDLAKVSRIIEALYPVNPRYGLADIARLLAQHPEWDRLNASVPMGPIDREMLQTARHAPWLGDL